jgi:hypothetical protein
MRHQLFVLTLRRGSHTVLSLRLGNPEQAVAQEPILHSSWEVVSQLHVHEQECHLDSGFFVGWAASNAFTSMSHL